MPCCPCRVRVLSCLPVLELKRTHAEIDDDSFALVVLEDLSRPSLYVACKNESGSESGSLSESGGYGGSESASQSESEGDSESESPVWKCECGWE